jgi:hypothetical protein
VILSKEIDVVLKLFIRIWNFFFKRNKLEKSFTSSDESKQKPKRFNWDKETIIRRVVPAPVLCLVTHKKKEVSVLDGCGNHLYNTWMCDRCNHVDMSKEFERR